MAAYKKKNEKKITQKFTPNDKHIAQGGDPDHYYTESPAWVFSNADKEKWAFTKEGVGDIFWDEIFPYLSELERKTWQEILVTEKKKNHSIELNGLNACAKKRLADLHIEAESLISLRLTGNKRIYGFMTGRAFSILWFDANHGDNFDCVCRSRLKNT